MARRIRRLLTSATLGLAALGCGPGSLASNSETGSSSTETETSTETGGLPPLPEQMGCLERGGSAALVDTGKIIVESYAGYAISEDIVATDEALLAFWRLGFNGSDPMPNVFVGVLDDERNLVGEPTSLREEPATAGPRVHRDDQGLILSLCARWGALDRATTMRLDASGQIAQDPIRRQPDDRNCGIAQHVPDAIWVGGDRYLSAHRDNSSGPVPGYELVVDRFDQAGQSLEWHQVQDNGDWDPEPRFVATEEAVFLVSSAPEGEEPGVMLHRFDTAGNWLPNEQRELELPPGVEPGEIALAADAEGIVLWMTTEGLPLRWKLDPLGEPLLGPIEVELELEPGEAYEALELERRPGGFAAAAVRANWLIDETAIVIAWLDEDGAPVWTTEIEPPGQPGDAYVYNPALSQRGDSTYVLWQVVGLSGPLDDTRSLLVTEVACI